MVQEQEGKMSMRTNGHQRHLQVTNGPRMHGQSAQMVETGLREHTQPPNRREPPDEMADRQRWMAAAAGGVMLWQGLRQRNAGKWVMTLLGAGLVYQGVSGNNVLGQLPVVQPVVKTLTTAQEGLRVRKTLTINRPAAELYEYWRNLENLPRFMHHVKEVQQLDEGRSHWRVAIMDKMELEWDAEITVDRPNEMIAWGTLPGATVAHRGYVKFIPAPGDRGTEISVALEYDPPGAALGIAAGSMAKFIPAQDIKEEIRNFKQIMEAGAIPTTEGQPACRHEAWRQHALREDTRQEEA